MLRRKTLNEFGISVTLIVGALGHLLLHLLEFGLHLRLVSECLARFLLHGRIVRKLHHLRQVAYCRIIRYRNGPARRLLHPTEYLQHG